MRSLFCELQEHVGLNSAAFVTTSLEVSLVCELTWSLERVRFWLNLRQTNAESILQLRIVMVHEAFEFFKGLSCELVLQMGCILLYWDTKIIVRNSGRTKGRVT